MEGQQDDSKDEIFIESISNTNRIIIVVFHCSIVLMKFQNVSYGT